MAQQISEHHPEYAEFQEDWLLMRDAYRGERRVKLQGTIYLPYTKAHVLDGAGSNNLTSVGQQDYNAYKKRARFDNFVREAVQTAIGMMHSQPPDIKLPKAMEDIRSSKGETLADLLRRINVEQLITGRVGILADIPKQPRVGQDLPYLTTYIAERVINWDEKQLFVLDESEFERGMGLSWRKKNKYRVLAIDESGNYGQQEIDEDNSFSLADLRTPSYRGRTLEQIPFAIANSVDVTNEVDEPPLLDLANLCMTIYRGDADYRHNLFMQGQDTFVTTGANFAEDEDVRVGAGARLDLPMGATAEYVGVTSQGLEEQRNDLSNLRARAGTMGAQTLDSTSRERESGDSLRIRVAARTADMNQIVEVGAHALEDVLKSVAIWIGENPDEVSVVPNKEFGEAPLTGQTMVEIATAATLGYPISQKSMHDLAFRRRMTRLTYEEEIEQAKKEKADEKNPFIQLETADRAGADQNAPGTKTTDQQSAREQAFDQT